MATRKGDLSRLLKGIFPELSYDEETKILKLEDTRVVILYADTVVSTQRRIESILGFDTAGMLLYEAYKEAGRTGAEIIRKGLGVDRVSSSNHILRAMDMAGTFAWGKWEMTEFDKFKSVFKVYRSPIAEVYGESKRAVCHSIRGLLAGFAEVFAGKKRESVEFKCRSKGDDYCEFVVAEPAIMTKMTLERLSK